MGINITTAVDPEINEASCTLYCTFATLCLPYPLVSLARVETLQQKMVLKVYIESPAFCVQIIKHM